jgi:hypothetical protein
VSFALTDPRSGTFARTTARGPMAADDEATFRAAPLVLNGLELAALARVKPEAEGVTRDIVSAGQLAAFVDLAWHALGVFRKDTPASDAWGAARALGMGKTSARMTGVGIVALAAAYLYRTF